MLFKDTHSSLLTGKVSKVVFPIAGQIPGPSVMGTSMVVSVPYRGELADRPVALAAAEWEWLSRHVREGMPTPL